MEEIIKKIIDIESSAKERLNEVKKLREENIEDCRIEFQQIKQAKYKDINKKIETYRNEQNKILESNVKNIESNQEKNNRKLIDDFNANYDSILQNLYDKITR